MLERLATYTRLTNANYHWDNHLRYAKDRRKEDARTELDKSEIDRAAFAAAEALAHVLLVSPVEVGNEAREAVKMREAFISYLKPREVSLAKLDREWEHLKDSRKSLRDVMRADLGLEPIGTETSTRDAADKSSGHSYAQDRQESRAAKSPPRSPQSDSDNDKMN